MDIKWVSVGVRNSWVSSVKGWILIMRESRRHYSILGKLVWMEWNRHVVYTGT